MSASLREQRDIYDLLASTPDFVQVHAFAEAYGVARGENAATEASIDMALGAHGTRGNARAGLVLIVLRPVELSDEQGSFISGTRLHTVRVIEVPEICRKSGGPKDSQGQMFTADLAKDYVMMRLDNRALGNATLVWAKNEPWSDKKGGSGWEITFAILMSLPSETRAAQVRIGIAGATVTLTGAGAAGERIYFTTDGRMPTPANGNLYAAPFVAPTGTRIRAASIATDLELGGATEDTVP